MGTNVLRRKLEKLNKKTKAEVVDYVKKVKNKK